MHIYKTSNNYKMNNKKVGFFLLLMGISFASFCQRKHIGQSQNSNVNKVSKVVKHQVVIHVSNNDTAAWKGLMNNIKHLKEIWGDSVQIEVVAHGSGIELLVAAKTTQQKKIAEYKKTGVAFAACENTMRQRNITKADMIAEADFVPSGVGEVIMKEENGWSYLKSGF